MIVVGLAGLARSGKDTVADHLVENHGFVKLSFAKPLKDMVRRLDPIVGGYVDYEADCECGGCDGQPTPFSDAIYLSDLTLDDEALKRSPYYPEIRRIWQKFGTDCVRTVDENFWLNLMSDTLQALPEDAKVVIPDARFQNELDLIDGGHRPLKKGARHTTFSDWFCQGDYDSWTFIVERPGVVDTTGHSSEQVVKLTSVDDTIRNDGTVEDLRKHVDTLLNDYGVA